MRFIEKGKNVQVQIAFTENDRSPLKILADFEIPKTDFMEFLDHVILECKKAYQRDELFPSVFKDGSPLEEKWHDG